MPQVTPRLPNSSGGGEPPQFTIDEKAWEQIKGLIRPGFTEDQATVLRAELGGMTSKYLMLVNAALSVPVLGRRKDQFSGLARALGTVRHKLEGLQIGDEGDFYTAFIEHNLSHPDLDDGRLGKLTEFRDRTHKYEDVVRAVETACEAGRKGALASAQAGLQPAKIWNIWVRETAGTWQQHGLSVAVRNDDLGVSTLVQLIDILQSALDQQYRQHTKTPAALSRAVSRALANIRHLLISREIRIENSGRKKAPS
jgi:hypothetical protein